MLGCLSFDVHVLFCFNSLNDKINEFIVKGHTTSNRLKEHTWLVGFSCSPDKLEPQNPRL